MNEVFTNALEITLTVDDHGISVQLKQDVAEFPYGSIEEKLKVGMLGNVNIIGHGITRTFVALGKDKARLKEAIAYAEKMNKQAAPCMPREYEAAPIEDKEYRKRCNVCGHIFCYTDKDIKENEKNAKIVERNRRSAVVNALAGTSIQSSMDTANADRMAARIIDFNRCSKCNSTDLSEITKEEFEKVSFAAPIAQAAVSAADELKKFKELLDMGVITQEEFDAKKKQLLGL